MPRPTGRIPIHAKGFGIPHATGFIQRDTSHAKGFIPPDKTRIAGRPPENKDKIGGVTNKHVNTT